MTPRIYSNIAFATSLVSGITAAATSLVVADATGYPAAPFALVVDAGSATYEEVMLVTAKAGATFTVTRGYDGTTAKVHAAGALVIHAAIADDFRGMQLGAREVSSAAPADGDVVTWDAANSIWEPGAGGASAAPASASYVTTAAEAGLSNEKVLGTAVIMAGLVAARPAAGTGGRLYYATDTDTLSRDNGVSWDDLTIDWGQVTGEPTTLAGYGITDAASDAELTAHEADTTAVHGIANTADLSTNIPNDSITYAKIQNVSATDRVLGRSTAGAGDVEEITFTAAARALADDATAAAMLTTLGAATAVTEGRPKQGATTYYTIPGVSASVIGGTLTVGANRIHYLPIRVRRSITIDQLAIEVTTNGSAGQTARLALYSCDNDRQPTSLIVDAGSVAVDSTGVKTASINVTLSPGTYLLAFRTEAAALVVRRIAGDIGDVAAVTTLGASLAITETRVSAAYAAFPDPGTAWDTVNNSTTPFIYFVWCRVSNPAP